MSLASVRDFFAAHASDIAIVETAQSTATVALAAAAHGVAPAQIAKTLTLRVRGAVVLVVMAGDARLDNRKARDFFGSKTTMLGADEVEAATGHPVGGVCPFGLPGQMGGKTGGKAALRVLADVSLRRFDVVVPAAGSTTSALFIAPERLALLAGAEWVDVARVG